MAKVNWNITFLTGAGLSCASGLPAFRFCFTPENWRSPYLEARRKAVRTLYDLDHKFDIKKEWFDINSPNWIDHVPDISRFFVGARDFVSNCKPCKAHHLISEWQRLSIIDGRQFNVITTNVDDLHERAGSQNVVKVHGDIFVDGLPIEATEDGVTSFYPMPDVVLFGQGKKRQADVQRIIEQSSILVVVGSSLSIFGDSALLYCAKDRGAKVIEVNPVPTGHPAFDMVIPKEANIGVRELFDVLAA
jgi:NAD-dependent deacetylase